MNEQTIKGSMMKIERENYTALIEAPTLYVDNESKNRSGHMTHAMAEFAPDKIIVFNSNCSAVRSRGHSTFGWVEYRISEDAGKTFGAVQTLEFSMNSLLDGVYTISVEKAVACPDGSIVAICLQNSTRDAVCCEPWGTPLAIRSTDGGKSWSEPIELSPYGGRVYDACVYEGVIYALHFCNEYFLGEKPEDLYRLYRSTDNGLSFEEVGVVPFDTVGRGYGAMLFDAEGVLHAYAYNSNSESELDHVVSSDFGKSWSVCKPCYLDKGIRNPQIALIDGVYILHGRAGGVEGFVFYISDNAADWDEGTFMIRKKDAWCYYSNNLNLRDEQGNFLLIQYSDVYDGRCRVNVYHTRLRINK